MKAKTIPAVVYLRMSSDDQTVSIDRQKQEVAKLAEREGYKVLRTYTDEGKSGSKDQEKRTEFNRLLLDAPSQEFRAVLVYNASRFARLDTIEGALPKQILRSHGIYLHTVNEGRIDWNTTEGRMMDFMLSEQNHAYSRSLSKDSISGRVRALERGEWPHGAVPYGFDREYSHGTQTTLVRRTDRFRKPRGWVLKLVTNTEEAAVVRRIFADFTTKAQSMRQIARQLNAEHVPPPDNLPGAQKLGWTNITVGHVLQNKAYVGIAEVGRIKHTEATAFNRMPQMEKEGVCPKLVDNDTFDAAQRLLNRNRERKSRQQSSRCGVLSGFLKCDQCGYSLCKEQRGTGPTKYVCKSTGRTDSECPQWFVWESEILPGVARRVTELIDAEVLRLLDTPDDDQPDRTGILTKHVDALTKKLATAKRRYLEADDDVAQELQEDLRRIKGELAEAEAALRLAQTVDNEGGVTSFAEWWEEQKNNTLFAVLAHNTYEGGMIRETVAAGAMLRGEPQPDYVSDDFGVLREVDHNPDLGEPDTALSQPVAFDQDGFRALLNQLGVSVSVKWRESKAPKRKGGNRRWIVDAAALEIDVTWQQTQQNAGEKNKHVLESRNGTSSRAASPAA